MTEIQEPTRLSPPRPCPGCGRKQYNLGFDYQHEEARARDLGVCGFCGGIFRVGEDGALRQASQEELLCEEVPEDFHVIWRQAAELAQVWKLIGELRPDLMEDLD